MYIGSTGPRGLHHLVYEVVDRVVDDLVDEMVKAARAGAADVHPGSLAYGFEPFEDRDVLGSIGAVQFLFTANALGFLGQLVPSGSHRKPRPPDALRGRGRVDAN